MKWWPVLLAFGLGTGLTHSASADSAPLVQVQVDQSVVGVGDTIHVQLSATSSDAMPGDPRLGATPGFVVRGQNQSSQTQINIGGTATERYTLIVDWLIQADRIGLFSIGPPTVAIHGARYASRSIALRVVAAGRAPARKTQPPPQQSPFGLSPFDPWRGLFPDFGNAPEPAAPPVAVDPKLALDAPRDPVYFLRATTDKAAAVVGEQVTLNVYEYLDISSGSFEREEDHDPQVADFVKHSLIRDDQDAPLVGYASIGGRTWRVNLARRWALFPLQVGDLVIGPMSVTISPAHQRGNGAFKRTSEALHVRVSEPPMARRPPGYALGDVGRFSLRAQVDPRDVPQGGAIGVHVELAGTGSPPSALTPPATDGAEWLPPEIHDELGTVGHDSYGGKRSFDFVVRLKRAGDIQLGQLTWPYWDPEQKKYELARAALGVVHVSPSASAKDQPVASAPDLLPGLPSPHDVLEGTPAARRHWDDSPLFWLAAVLGWPLLLGATMGATAAGKRLTLALRGRATSPAAELRERIAAARQACRGEDARGADAAIARALEAATVASAGVSIRGAIGDQVVRRLESAGVDSGSAWRVAELLRECEAARFAPEAVDVAQARERWDRAQQAIRHLERIA
jgi:hypothetical protein